MSAKLSPALEQLRTRATIIKADENLRHIPNENDLRIASENAQDMAHIQYKTIKQEERD